MKELPLDLVFSEILPRPPAKSLLHFKYVSKVWLSTLKSTKFALLHIRKNTDAQNQKLLVNVKSYNSGPIGKIFTLDYSAGNHDGNRCEFLLEAHNTRFILGSCNGLVCIGIGIGGFGSKRIDLVLWNPLTREYKRLGPSSSLSIAHLGSLCGLGYDSSSDDYKVLHVTKDQGVYIYSLRSQSKRNIEACYGTFSGYSFYKMKQGVCVQGTLYWIVVGDRDSLKILRFDLPSEMFMELPFPVVEDRFQNLTIHSGSLHMFTTSSSSSSKKSIHVWRMDEDKTQAWVKVMSVSLFYIANCVSIRPLCFVSSKQILIRVTYSNNTQLVIKYNTVDHTSEWCSSINRVGIEIYPTYIETLVSPNL